ncbi:TPA: DUF3987 domain-containing protein [Kluyvera cryocrescens]|nr:DUF3987 domain-containing protein [Kluyvera cryocrescens]
MNRSMSHAQRDKNTQPALLSYPVNALPGVIGNVTRALHDDMQVPVELIAGVVLSTLSLACQSLIDVKPLHSDTPEPCSIYNLILAGSGEGKTTIYNLVMKPVQDHIQGMQADHQRDYEVYLREYEVWKIRAQALKSSLKEAVRNGYSGDEEDKNLREHINNEPVKPGTPDFLYEDVSLKGFIQGLSEQSAPDAGIMLDEAITFFKGNMKDNPSLLNKAWDGDRYSFRRANGDTYNLNIRLTTCMMVQTGVFMDFYRKNIETARLSGLLARFNITPVNSTLGQRQRNIDFSRSSRHLKFFHVILVDLLTKRQSKIKSGEPYKETYKLSDDAKILLQNKRMEIEKNIAPGHKWAHISDVAAKAGANILRISAIFSYVLSGGTLRQFNDIIASDVERAIKIVEWHLEQTSALFFPFSERYQFEQDVRDLYVWIREKFNQNNGFPFPRREIEKNGPNRLRKANKLEPVLNQLVHQGVVVIINNYYNHKALHIALPLQNGTVHLPYEETLSGGYVDIIHYQLNTPGQPEVDLSNL